MDWLTFFSTNIKSLAWPIVVIVALFVLKRQITNLVYVLGNRLLTAKGGGFEFTFASRYLPDPAPEDPRAQSITSIWRVCKVC